MFLPFELLKPAFTILAIHVHNARLAFTTTGGVFSDWFFHTIIKPYCKINKIEPMPYHLYTDEKDLTQFKSFTTKNRLSGVVVYDADQIPIHVYHIDYRALYHDYSGPKCSNMLFGKSDCFKLRAAFESNMTAKQTCASTLNNKGLSIVFNRNVPSIIKYLCTDESDRYWNPKLFEPGPGFQFLTHPTGPIDNTQLTNYEYIRGAHTDLFSQTAGAYQLNPFAHDLTLPNPNVPYLGRIPPRKNETLKVVHPSDVSIPALDQDAYNHFKHLGLNDVYHVAPICLKNEAESLFKFCPDNHASQIHPNFDEGDADIVAMAFELAGADWGIEPQSIGTTPIRQIGSRRNWKSSPGFPYNTLGATTCQDAYTAFASHINEVVERSAKHWQPTVFNVFGKAEILKAEKGNDIRTVIAPDLAHQLMCQRLTLNIADRVGSNFSNSHTQIGRTRFRGDVDNMMKRLKQETTETIEEYDISKWDRTIQAFLIKLFFVYCWLILDTDYRVDFNSLANMFESTIYSHMVLRSGDLYRKRYGIPSGFTLTSYANSFIHTFLNYFMFIKLSPKHYSNPSQAKTDADAHFNFVNYGDDGLMVHHKKHHWFSTKARSQLLKRVFNINMEPHKCKSQPHLKMVYQNGDIDGIRFLGDVIWYHEPTDTHLPVFSLTKVIGSLIHGGSTKHYTPLEKILIAYTHFVECAFHPRHPELYAYLQHVFEFNNGAIETMVTDLRTDVVGASDVSTIITVLRETLPNPLAEELWNYVVKNYYMVDLDKACDYTYGSFFNGTYVQI